MYVTSGHAAEITLTLEAMVDLVNALGDARVGEQPADVRALLSQHGFTRAPTASAASIDRIESRMLAMTDVLATLPDVDTATVVTWVNDQLSELAITPSVTDHDGAGLHIHWTPSNARFDDQVIADVLMALAQDLCDHGTTRFGSCAATDCSHLFYDSTRNGSRRFCADPRCASRTHTATHRARQRTS
ncbi:MAG TPA: CGNR zinc finger domain-containing protein [Ilumatobacteraceae bacterium]|nr:CGNR zinc finger domain-containing protein [Ilumatobacteraceae bacterium]